MRTARSKATLGSAPALRSSERAEKRRELGSHIKGRSSNPLTPKTKDQVLQCSSNATCKAKERSKLDKDIETARPKIVKHANADISVHS
ncbi:unnamed protein product [Lupinus luteus]|uniref:Uncharacterized protein n=1 Tax=Lupinus luteus TaxID=3873 RepID=A0AAV1XHH1_LUPLU